MLPLYALLLHCGEHLREKGRKKDEARAEKKLALHRQNNVSLIAKTLLSTISKRSAGAAIEAKAIGNNNADGSSQSASAAESNRNNVTDAKSDSKSDGLMAAPDPGGANIGGSADRSNSSASKYAVG